MTEPRPSRIVTRLLRLGRTRHDFDALIGDLAEDASETRAARPSGWPRLALEWRAWRYLVAAPPRPRIPLASEYRWAWRAVRARAATSAFHATLIAVTIAANAVVFSAADAFVFRPVIYPNADRLFVLQRTGRFDAAPSEGWTAEEIAGWRRHADVFSGIETYDDYQNSLAVTLNGVATAVPVTYVAPGLFDVLGVAPAWGRPFRPADRLDKRAVIISDRLARQLAATPASVVGRTFQAGGESRLVIGVMPPAFRFPAALQDMWLPLDIDAAARPHEQVSHSAIFLAAPGRSTDDVVRAVADRHAAVVKAAHTFGPVVAPVVRTLADARRDTHRVLLGLLVGAGACLLLIACLNIASVEFTAAIARGRTFAVHSALGASRWSLARTALFEGGIVTGIGAASALVLATWAASALNAWLPSSMANRLSNPIDVDGRVVLLVLAASAAAWLTTSLGIVWRASRTNLMSDLRRDARASGITRGQQMARHALMTGQVALTVLLLVVAVLFVRSYGARAREPKGFDSTQLAAITVTPQVRWGDQPTRADIERQDRLFADMNRRLFDRVRMVSGVAAASMTERIPPSMAANTGTRMEIRGRTEPTGWVNFANYVVDANYFETLGIHIIRGRAFRPTDPPGDLVVDEDLANRFWPNGDALGAEFHVRASALPDVWDYRIVGIASHVRGDTPDTPADLRPFVVYPQFSRDLGAGQFCYLLRLDDASHLTRVVSAIRAAEPAALVKAEMVDERYARLYGDTRVAAGITSGFGALAFLVAIAGVYGVMAFLVAGRTREIGIRLALGAAPRAIHRLIVGPAIAFVALGIVIGLGLARLVSQMVASQLFHVSPTDATAHASIALLVLATAMVATWHPARAATRIDPAITLRAE